MTLYPLLNAGAVGTAGLSVPGWIFRVERFAEQDLI